LCVVFCAFTKAARALARCDRRHDREPDERREQGVRRLVVAAGEERANEKEEGR